jgi:hypothetical protein
LHIGVFSLQFSAKAKFFIRIFWQNHHLSITRFLEACHIPPSRRPCEYMNIRPYNYRRWLRHWEYGIKVSLVTVEILRR